MVAAAIWLVDRVQVYHTVLVNPLDRTLWSVNNKSHANLR
jgi:hypothetical protein